MKLFFYHSINSFNEFELFEQFKILKRIMNFICPVNINIVFLRNATLRRCTFNVQHCLSYFRHISSSNIVFGKLSDKFNEAQIQVTNLSEDPGNEVKLSLYALYKQVRFTPTIPRHTLKRHTLKNEKFRFELFCLCLWVCH